MNLVDASFKVAVLCALKPRSNERQLRGLEIVIDKENRSFIAVVLINLFKKRRNMKKHVFMHKHIYAHAFNPVNN